MKYISENQNPDVSHETILEQINKYKVILAKWNKAINLISRKLSDRELDKHIEDCIYLGHLIGEGSKIIDVGSGNGLPGIILSIMGFKCVLIEINTKKAVFLNEVINHLKLNAKVINDDIKLCGSEIDPTFNIIVSKAVGTLSQILKLTKLIIDKNSIIYLIKNNNAIDEIEDAKNICNFKSVIIENENLDDTLIVELKEVKFN